MMAHSCSPSAWSRLFDRAMSTPSDETATASVTPAVSSTKLVSSQLKLRASSVSIVTPRRRAPRCPARRGCVARRRPGSVRNRWISAPSTGPMMPHPGRPPQRPPLTPRAAAAPRHVAPRGPAARGRWPCGRVRRWAPWRRAAPGHDGGARPAGGVAGQRVGGPAAGRGRAPRRGRSWARGGATVAARIGARTWRAAWSAAGTCPGGWRPPCAPPRPSAPTCSTSARRTNSKSMWPLGSGRGRGRGWRWHGGGRGGPAGQRLARAAG